MVAISGADGAIIWELEKPEKEYYINLYNVLIIRDVNADNHMDIIASHTAGDTSKFGPVNRGKINSALIKRFLVARRFTKSRTGDQRSRG